MSPYLVLLPILKKNLPRLAMLLCRLVSILQNYYSTCQDFCIFIIMQIVFCNLVLIKCIILYYCGVEILQLPMKTVV